MLAPEYTAIDTARIMIITMNIPNRMVPTAAVSDEVASVNTSSAAQELKSAIASGDMEHMKQNSAQKTVVLGKSSDSKIQVVTTNRKIDLFVSRVHPSLAVSIVEECVLMP